MTQHLEAGESLDLGSSPAPSENQPAADPDVSGDARRTLALLEAVVHRIVDDDDAASALGEMAELLARLGDARSALSIAREALRRQPRALYVARGFRRMAVRAGRAPEQLIALEAEGKVVTQPAYKAALELERGRLLEAAGQAGPAQAAYEAALAGHRAEVVALSALERLAGQRNEPVRAAELAQKLADAVADPELAAAHRARAARWQLEAGDIAAARTQANRISNSVAPAARWLSFQLAAEGAVAEQIELRIAEIADGSIHAGPGWFDVGVLAWYGANDARRASEAFAAAAEKSTGPSKAAALAELAVILVRRSDWPALLDVERQRLELEQAPERRAVLWTRIATLLEDRLLDQAAAADAYEQALGEDSSYLPALEGAGRLFQKLASRDRLLRMHELEARSAGSSLERGHAFRRLGELLVEEPERREEGIVALRAALAEVPGDTLIVAALQRALVQHGAWAELVALHEDELTRTTARSRRDWLLSEIGTLAADRLGLRPRAIAAFREAAAGGATGPHYVLTRLAQLLEEEGDLAGVAETLTSLAENTREPTELASILERVARAQEQQGDLEGAFATFGRALAIAPPSHSVTVAAARSFLRAGRFHELAMLNQRLSETTTGAERARYLYKAADVAARHLDKPDDAIAYLNASLALTPTFAPARTALLALLTAQGRWREAAEQLAQDPSGDEPVTLIRRAVLAEAAGERDTAVELYGRALAAGVDIAAAGYDRLLAASRRWPSLAAHYLSKRTALVERHARFRAAQLLVEQLDDLDGAAAALEDALITSPGDVALLEALRPLITDPERARAVLEELTGKIEDPPTRYAYLLELARGLDDAGLADEALVVRQRLLLEVRDPVVETAVELGLETAGRDDDLIAHWRRQAIDPATDPAVAGRAQVAAGTRLLALGRVKEAAAACAGARELGLRSLTSTLLACRVYRELGDVPRRQESLAALAEALPGGEERAAVLGELARELEAGGDEEGALTAFKGALRAHPLDSVALAGYDRLLSKRGDPVSAIDPLTRAFQAEEEPARRVTLAVALIGRLLAAGRLQAVGDVLTELGDLARTDLRLLVLAAELHDRREAWTELARAYQAILDHDEASPELWFQALWRLIAVRVVRLEDKAGAREAASLLREVRADDLPSWELRLRMLEMVGDAKAMAEVLRTLSNRDELPDQARAHYTLRLAELEEEDLNDPAAAIETLSRVTSPGARREVVSRLLELGERTGRWASAASALEAALDRGGERDASWEVAIRTRLASLLEGPLGRPESAGKQYEQIVALDPGNVDALERLVTLLGKTDPASAIEHHRALLAQTPGRLASYHELRELFLALDQQDAAFCAEAVLVGLGEATEEEAYFYRQRRARLPAEPSGVLTAEERTALVPETARPIFTLLRLVSDHLHAVFPIDLDGYGIASDAGVAPDHPLAVAAGHAARLLGVEPLKVVVVSPRLGPAVEFGTPPLLLLPRSLEDAARREQLHACGELLGRVASGGILGHPRRQGPGGGQIIDYVVWATCSIVEPSFEAPAQEQAVFRDIRRRLEPACAAIDADALRAAVAAHLAEDTPMRGEQTLPVLAHAAIRAGILAAQDPAIAIAAIRAAGADGLVVDKAGSEAMADTAFAVSAAFLDLRKRLGLEVRS